MGDQGRGVYTVGSRWGFDRAGVWEEADEGVRGGFWFEGFLE